MDTRDNFRHSGTVSFELRETESRSRTISDHTPRMEAETEMTKDYLLQQIRKVPSGELADQMEEYVNLLFLAWELHLATATNEEAFPDDLFSFIRKLCQAGSDCYLELASQWGSNDEAAKVLVLLLRESKRLMEALLMRSDIEFTFAIGGEEINVLNKIRTISDHTAERINDLDNGQKARTEARLMVESLVMDPSYS